MPQEMLLSWSKPTVLGILELLAMKRTSCVVLDYVVELLDSLCDDNDLSLLLPFLLIEQSRYPTIRSYILKRALLSPEVVGWKLMTYLPVRSSQHIYSASPLMRNISVSMMIP